MTDRVNALVVVLENDIREEEAGYIVNALGMLRGVVSVTANVADIEVHIAKQRAKRELMAKIHEVLE